LNLLEHMEHYLGEITRGWSEDDRGRMPFQLVEFAGAPGAGPCPVGTIGLSRHELHFSRTGKPVREELIMLLSSTDVTERALAILDDLASEALGTHHAYAPGQVIRPRGPVVEGSEMEALYVAAPSYLPDEFGSVDTPDGTVLFAWILPISRAEAEFVETNGRIQFERLLESLDPDLTDLARASVV
jgi:hypothetical protein